MKLHVFNPDHDIALAVNMEQFTEPNAARELRADLGYVSLQSRLYSGIAQRCTVGHHSTNE